MDQLTPETIKIISDLGTSALLLYFLIMVWKDRKVTVGLKEEIIAEKDKLMQENRTEVLEVVKNNTKAQERMATLTERIYQLLERSNK